MDRVQYYVFLLFALLLLILLVPVVAFIHRQARKGIWTPAQLELRWFTNLSILFLILDTLELLMPTRGLVQLFASLCYLCLTGAPSWWFLFALGFAGYQKLSRRIRPFLIAASILCLLVVFTNDLHHLHWRQVEFAKDGSFLLMTATEYGPLFWILIAFLDILVISGAAIILFSISRRARAFTGQNVIVIIACFLPIVVNHCYILKLIPGFRKDFSAVSFALSSLLFVISVYYSRLFDLVPIARSALVESLTDPLVAVDEDGRILDANPAALSLFPDSAIGSPSASIPFLSRCVEALQTSGTARAEVSPDGQRWYEAQASTVCAGKRQLKLYTLRDITERRLLVDKLSKALSEIQTLEGIIPICSYCRKVRDDSGYWQQVEAYISNHTAARFSHGLCPGCHDKLYQEFMDSPNGGKGDNDGSASQGHES